MKTGKQVTMSDPIGIYQKEVDRLVLRISTYPKSSLPKWITDEMIWDVKKGRGTTGLLKIAIHALKRVL